MKKYFLFLFFLVPGFAVGQDIQNPTPCSTFGVISGTCVQGGAPIITPSITINGGASMTRYIEGTWIPVMKGSSTPGTPTCGTASGNYTQIGRFFSADFTVSCTSTTGMVGNVAIGALPITPNGFVTCSLFEADGLTYSVGYTWLSGYVLSGGTDIRISQNGTSGVSELDLPVSGLTGGTYRFFGECHGHV